MFFATGFRNENVYVFQSRGLVVSETVGHFPSPFTVDTVPR